MNLELLDPFGRQIPDRIDSTLSLPSSLHFRSRLNNGSDNASNHNAAANNKSSSKKSGNAVAAAASAPVATSKRSGTGSGSGASGKRGAASTSASAAAAAAAAAAVVEDLEWKAAYHVSYNRRGTYLAVGYGSSTVAVFNTLTRTLAALYQSDVPHLRPGNIQDGVTSLTWSRRSRTLLCGAAGDATVKLYDSGHPHGPDQACLFALLERPNMGVGAAATPSGTADASGTGGGSGDPDDHSTAMGASSVTATKTPKKSRSKTAAGAAGSNAGSHVATATAAATTTTGPGTESVHLTSPTVVPNATLDKTKNTSFADPEVPYVYSNERRPIAAVVWEMGAEGPPPPPPATSSPTSAAGGGKTLQESDDADDSQSLEVEKPSVGRDRPRRRRSAAATKATRSSPAAAEPVEDATMDDATLAAGPVEVATASKNPEAKSLRDGDGDGDGATDTATVGDKDGPPQAPSPRIGAPLKHPCVSIEFDHPVGGALQVNPRIPTAGLAALIDGTLVLFYVPPRSFVSNDNVDESTQRTAAEEVPLQEADAPTPQTLPSPKPPHAWIVPLIGPGASPKGVSVPWSSSAPTKVVTPATPPPWITCASFDHRGEYVFAATKDGTLFVFHVQPIWSVLQHHGAQSNADVTIDAASNAALLPVVEPHVRLSIGGSTAWHLLVSRNGKDLVVNSSDGALRLFKVADLMTLAPSATASLSKSGRSAASATSTAPSAAAVVKPMVFQDVVTKVKFACCDLSGDGEHLVGGANGDDTKYRLYLWSTATGVLLDKLTGPPLQLYSVAWHPSRSFVAVATSDGLVDVWGPRVNWTAFAPDFQALPHNVEYVEREDEFDVDETGRYLVETLPSSSSSSSNSSPLPRPANVSGGDLSDDEVDVTTVEKVPVFASDTEDEEDVFHYDVRLVNLLTERKGKPRDKSLDVAD